MAIDKSRHYGDHLEVSPRKRISPFQHKKKIRFRRFKTRIAVIMKNSLFPDVTRNIRILRSQELATGS